MGNIIDITAVAVENSQYLFLQALGIQQEMQCDIPEVTTVAVCFAASPYFKSL